MCNQGAIEALPAYLSVTVKQFFGELGSCIPAPPLLLGIEVDYLKPAIETGNDDYHCKTSKINQLERLVESIKVRVEAWKKYVRADPANRKL